MGAGGDIPNTTPPPPDPTATELKNLQAEVDFLKGQVRWLMGQVERSSQTVRITPDGFEVHAGDSLLSVLASNGITLNSKRIELKTPGKDEVRV